MFLDGFNPFLPYFQHIETDYIYQGVVETADLVEDARGREGVSCGWKRRGACWR